MVRKNKKSCGLFLGIMIFSILVALASLPLFVVGANNMEKEPPTLFETGMNPEMITATTMSSVGSTMAVVFGLLYVACK